MWRRKTRFKCIKIKIFNIFIAFCALFNRDLDYDSCFVVVRTYNQFALLFCECLKRVKYFFNIPFNLFTGSGTFFKVTEGISTFSDLGEVATHSIVQLIEESVDSYLIYYFVNIYSLIMNNGFISYFLEKFKYYCLIVIDTFSATL